MVKKEQATKNKPSNVEVEEDLEMVECSQCGYEKHKTLIHECECGAEICDNCLDDSDWECPECGAGVE